MILFIFILFVCVRACVHVCGGSGAGSYFICLLAGLFIS